MARAKKDQPVTKKTGLQKLQEKYGKAMIAGMDDMRAEKLTGWSFGVSSINYICTKTLHLGIVRGAFYEIFGSESTGKTTLCLTAVGSVQRQAGKVLYVDAEHSLKRTHAKMCGVDTSKLHLAQPDFGEKTLDLIVDSVAKYDVIVVDSVVGLIPKKIWEASSEKEQMGMQAAMLSKTIPKIATLAAKSGTAILFVNQTRSKIGGWGDPTTTPGGMVLKFYASVRLCTKLSTSKKNAVIMGKTRIGASAIIENKKNKLGPPFLECDVSFRYGHRGEFGYDVSLDLFENAAKLGAIIKKQGGYVFAEDMKSAKKKVPTIPYSQLDAHAPRLWKMVETMDTSALLDFSEIKKEAEEPDE